MGRLTFGLKSVSSTSKFEVSVGLETSGIYGDSTVEKQFLFKNDYKYPHKTMNKVCGIYLLFLL